MSRRSCATPYGPSPQAKACCPPSVPTNDEIAAELDLAPASVRTYVGRLMAKLDARDRVALVVLTHVARLV